MLRESALGTRPHPRSRAVAAAREHRRRYQLVALAPTVADVVRYAGGWLFDRVTSGWEVTAIVAEHSDTRPLDILGVRVVDLESAFASRVRGPMPNALAVDTELFAADDRVRSGLLDLFDHELIDQVTFWGDRPLDDFGGRFDAVQHRASRAAQVFKARALSVAGHPAPVGAETFRCCEIQPGADGYRDLLPA
ncbi:hypothetical protein [Nocardia sp. alder85J]|uniref:hypothetical protein n=1 Tax=Nocardia sp. alder85J TaxID=2862949 RepID=UPI001CD3254D|nr:hypothetical protein [Nocardia sp. alder85J]MCX4094943.1 hypothetical protein [Nocardia sp. alder85J]